MAASPDAWVDGRALALVGSAHAALPPGFQRTIDASGLSEPTTLEFTPDGRLLVGERGGRPPPTTASSSGCT